MRNPNFSSVFGILLIPIVLMLAMSVRSPAQRVYAATCSGSGCEGLNPSTTQCDVSATSTTYTYFSGGRTDMRKSASATNCNTKWVKTSVGGDWLYAAATIKWGTCGSSCYSVSSPGQLRTDQVVYTAMHYPNTNSYTYCGKVAGTGPIATPLGGSDCFGTG